MGIVYKLKFTNGKVYIGITTETLQRRIQRHINYTRANKPYALSQAIRKYGEKSFSAEVIGEADLWVDLLALEIEMVRQHDSICPNGYNMTAGGEGSKGVAASVEKKRKISESLKGRKLSESHRMAVGLSQKGKKISDETRQKMRKAHKKRAPMSVEQRKIRSEAAKRQHAARKAVLEIAAAN